MSFLSMMWGTGLHSFLEIRNRQTQQPFLFATTHLTFPHHVFDEKLRVAQVNMCQNELQQIVREIGIPGIPIFFAGDFNCNKGTQDDVYQILVQSGWKSAFEKVHAREVKVSHKNHNMEQVGVDFVFFYDYTSHDERSLVGNLVQNVSVIPISAVLYPDNETDTLWPWSFDMSDHRPLKVMFTISNLSQD